MVKERGQARGGSAKGSEEFQHTAWLATRLTDKQRLYALYYIEFDGDWKQAAQKAGYSEKTPQSHIEEGEHMAEYMQLLKDEVAMAASLNSARLIARMDRIAERAEHEKNYSAAISANKVLMDVKGMLHQDAPPVHVNNEGVIINIINPRQAHNPLAPIDEVTREILARNSYALPQPSVTEAGVVED